MEAGDFQKARDTLHGDMLNTLLSPLSHLLNRDAADKLGEGGQAALEHEIYKRCVEAILATGSGTVDSPYLVLRVDDQGDVMRHREVLEGYQFLELLNRDGRFIERYQVAGEQEIAFDVTAPYGWLENWLGGVPEGMKPRMVGYLLHPNAEDFLFLREQLVASGQYNPYTRALERAGEALVAGDWAAVEELIRADMPNLLLSPRAHQLLGRAAQERGDRLNTGLRMQFGRALYDGLLKSGDGSEQRPWLCLREEDEADLISSFESPPVAHKTLGGDERFLERFALQDGSSVFFDLTTPFAYSNILFSVDS